MNAATSVGGLIGVICIVVGLYLQVRKQVAENRAAANAALEQTRRTHIRTGYVRRTAEVRPEIDRVVDILANIDLTAASEAARRQLQRAVIFLNDARDGDPDAEEIYFT